MVVKLETYYDGEFWCARGLSEDIFTQGKTYEELLANLQEAVEVHFWEEIKKGKTINILLISELEIRNAEKIAAG